MFTNDLDSHLTGHLTGLVTAHTIRQNGPTLFFTPTDGVFVAITHTTDIG
jgi:hypothetical protein